LLRKRPSFLASRRFAPGYPDTMLALVEVIFYVIVAIWPHSIFPWQKRHFHKTKTIV